MKHVAVKLTSDNYQITVGDNLLKDVGTLTVQTISPQTQKLFIVSNRKVFGLYGETVKKSLQKSGFEVFVELIGDGERYKNLRTLENTLKAFSRQKLARTDAIIALGGGVVGDLAGFAASIYLRGISFLQIPTTLLSMIDSSVGGKTGVNTSFGKNLIGAFHQPQGVFIDVKTLQTLPRRELLAGFCEAVKHGAIAHRQLFDLTADIIRQFPLNRFKYYFNNQEFLLKITDFLCEQIAFKAQIVMQDEKEDLSRNDFRSRKILNFGHTVGHALEKVTDYKIFKHGEAVGIGMLVAGEIAKNLEILEVNELNLLNDVVKCLGKMPDTKNINLQKTVEAISFDKKLIGNSVKWIMLSEIGKPLILDGKKIPEKIIKESLEKVLSK